ncbi:hypothetical protein [Roseicella aquatilis]|uniref:hypothetical protein n=1 Tax=Roseicella aquatilis TaxID=2527868 RepID=UPI001404D9F6|nr:hypothetical protein [Roseicella aquatilis]
MQTTAHAPAHRIEASLPGALLPLFGAVVVLALAFMLRGVPLFLAGLATATALGVRVAAEWRAEELGPSRFRG